jgi:hypothetical protein
LLFEDILQDKYLKSKEKMRRVNGGNADREKGRQGEMENRTRIFTEEKGFLSAEDAEPFDKLRINSSASSG